MPRTDHDEPLIPSLATPSFAVSTAPGQDMLSGPLGLRAGWGILLFLVLVLTLGVVLFAGLFSGTGHMAEFHRTAEHAREAKQHAAAAHQAPPPPVAGLVPTFLAETAETGAVLLAGLALGFFEKRRFGVYGLGLRHLRDVLPGAAVGLVAVSATIGLLAWRHLLVFDRRLLHGAAVARYGLGWLVVFALVGVFEEFLFRGYLQFTLMRGLLGLSARLAPARERAVAFWMAAGFWSLLFSLTHLFNAGENPAGLALVFVAGVLFSYALWRTGSLWWGIGFHLTWDWGQSFLYGVPDSGTLSAGRLFATHAQGKALLSGGPAGPEGSVYTIAVLVLVVLVLRLSPQGAQPPVEPESLPLVPQPQWAERIS